MRADSLSSSQLASLSPSSLTSPSFPPPSLPPRCLYQLSHELIAHILDLLDLGTLSYLRRDLYRCCLVARSFPAPATAALYRTIPITVAEDEQEDAETCEPTGEYYLTMRPSVFIRGDLGRLVRKLDVEISTRFEDLALPQELATLFLSCPLVDDVALREVSAGQVKGQRQILQSCRDKLRRVALSYCGEDDADALDSIALFLGSQTRLQHLSMSYWSDFPLPSPPPSFRLRSLCIDRNQPDRLNYLLNSSLATLQSLKICLQRAPESEVNLSAFITLTSLSLDTSDSSDIPDDFNLPICASLTNFTVFLNKPPTSIPRPPSLVALYIHGYPLPPSTLLDFLHSPQSSRLR